jgi:hypothetical protein
LVVKDSLESRLEPLSIPQLSIAITFLFIPLFGRLITKDQHVIIDTEFLKFLIAGLLFLFKLFCFILLMHFCRISFTTPIPQGE